MLIAYIHAAVVLCILLCVDMGVCIRARAVGVLQGVHPVPSLSRVPPPPLSHTLTLCPIARRAASFAVQ